MKSLINFLLNLLLITATISFNRTLIPEEQDSTIISLKKTNTITISEY